MKNVYYGAFRRIFGCTLIELKCEDHISSKILNELSQKNIYFWGTTPLENGGISLYGSVFSAAEIIETAENLGAETSVLKRIGLPFVFERYKRRYGIFIGLVLAWAILFLSSLTIWEVKVASRSGEDEKKICSLLKECGLDMGTFLPTLDIRAVENQFLLNNPEYSFLAVNINGTVANVEIRRATQKTDAENKDRVCNVVASKSGIIISVEAFGGFPLVKRGDTVEEGDVLISAFMEGSFGVTRAVHAYGKVEALVEYTFEARIPLAQKTSEQTGRKETKTFVQLLGFKIPLFSSVDSPFEKCIAESKSKRLSVFGISLPVVVEKVLYSETEPKDVFFSESQGEKAAFDDFELWKKREIKGEIVSESIESSALSSNGEEFVLKASVFVSEDIGEKQFFD